MAIHNGGIYSKPSGTAGSLVWGRARTFAGKLATSREWAYPNDPQTTDQQERRALFTAAVYHAGAIGNSIYSSAWDRTYGELPGWHSLLSWMIGNLQLVAGVTSYTDPLTGKNLGPCHKPQTMTLATGPGAGELELTWSTENEGDHSADVDEIFACCIENEYIEETRFYTRRIYDYSRSVGATGWSISGFPTGADVMCLAWFRHEEPDGSYTYSPVFAEIQTAG